MLVLRVTVRAEPIESLFMAILVGHEKEKEELRRIIEELEQTKSRFCKMPLFLKNLICRHIAKITKFYDSFDLLSIPSFLPMSKTANDT